MFEKINGIEIKGGCFEQSTELLFFENKKEDKTNNPTNIAVIYGANGSGKSSIANALLHYKNSDDNTPIVELLYENNKIIDKSKIKLDSLHVFNENFIHVNVRFTKDEKLNAIVLLGGMVELDNKISELEKEKSKTEINLSDYEKEEKNLTNKNNPSFYKYYNEAIKKILKLKWAEKDSKIKGNKTLTDVNDALVENFIKLNHDNFDEKKLTEEFDKKMAELEKAKEGNPINNPVNPFEIDKNIDENIHKLLAEVIEKPEFSKREKDILMILEKKASRIDEIKEEFNKDTGRCPFCFQDIDENYKNDLLKSISNIFDTKEAEEHKLNLEKINICNIDMDLTEYKQIDDVLVQNIEDEIKKYKEYIKEVKDKINQKKTNIYIPIDFKSDLLPKQNSIITLLQDLEEKRKQFNTNVKNKEKLKKELKEMNEKLAYQKLKNLDYIKQYNTCKKNYETNKKEKKNCEEKINNLSKEIKELKSQKNNTKLAVDIINKYLSYIFFDENRLQIEIWNENKYIVKVRNKEIKLKDLSEGEKNAIAMCCFFVIINQNKQEKDFFKDECFIVLDDPISSFDFNNKVGIYTFIRHILNEIKTNNQNSRVLIFTHQIEAMFQLTSVIGNKKEKANYLILNNHKLNDFKTHKNKHHEYSVILKNIFDYATNNNEHNNENIGNYMRKIVESFSLFNYKKTINEFFCDNDILDLINGDEKKEFFQNFMIKLVLHSESHLEEQIKAENFFDYISPEEKKKTAKLLLVFLKLLNELHLKKHLGENFIKDIDNWEQEFFPQKQLSQQKELLSY